ncbi:MAG: decaprenyl-phosphate phosphoribosyltransferase [Fimbriimonas sp.]|nr:decaprenyl-phosphate phosphoribosyltransferase [Fimbriimonas sp.]
MSHPFSTDDSPRTPSLPVSLLKLLRPKQWAKNLLVFAAILFTAGYHSPQKVVLAFSAFAVMCMAGSGTYVFNDLIDIDRDRHHPTKRYRPLASGSVPKSIAVTLGTALIIGSLAEAFILGKYSLLILCIYLALQVAYNWRLKHIPVADVFCISVGFVLRAAIGAAAIYAGISGWLLFCTGALALMLGFAKRRNEFIIQGENRMSSRISLTGYTKLTLDGFVLISACAASLCYGIYSLDSQTARKYPALILTAPFVFYGILRYVLLVFSRDEGGEPADILFGDNQIIICVVMFVACAALAVSGLRIPLLER